jgi:hypothetical protein
VLAAAPYTRVFVLQTSADESEAPVISLEETKDVMRKINAHVLESAVLVNQHALVICEALPQRKCQHMATQYAASVGMVAGPQVRGLARMRFDVSRKPHSSSRTRRFYLWCFRPSNK